MQLNRKQLRSLVRRVVRHTVREMLTHLGPSSVLVTTDHQGRKPDDADDAVPFYTVEALATRWGVDVKTVYSAISSKQVPVVRLGQRIIRIPAAVVHEMEHGRVPQGGPNGGIP